MSDACSIVKEPNPWRWWNIQCQICLYYHIIINIIESVICNVDKIVITELKIGLISRDLTIGQSELVVLRVPGYSSTEHAEWYHEGVLSVSGHCHLGELDML